MQLYQRSRWADQNNISVRVTMVTASFHGCLAISRKQMDQPVVPSPKYNCQFMLNSCLPGVYLAKFAEKCKHN